MSCLTNMCYVCLEKKDKSLININSSLSVNKDIIHIIGYLPCNLGWMKTKRIILICEECCIRLREFYQFLTMCLKNSALMQGYLDKVNTASTSTADNEAELRVDLKNKHDDTREIKLEEEEIDTFERKPIIDESEEVFVNVDDSFVKEEDTWKREEVECMEESPMDNNFTENSDKETDSDSSGFTHKQVHTTNKTEINEAATKSYTCSTCSRTFCTKFDLKKHTRVNTCNKPRECSDCRKCFISESDLCKRKRGHTGEKAFKCSTCEKCFTQKSNLVTHIRVHTGEKPYKCSTCEKCFSRLYNLKTHMRVHSGEKPFKCTRCEKCFSQTSHLAIHMRVHTGVKPFKCSRCEKCFGQKIDLVRHNRVHNGEKPYECSICKKCFSQKHNLVSHMRTHTGT